MSGVVDEELLTAVKSLRSRLEEAAFPVDTTHAEVARASRHALVEQLDDYVLPRLSCLDAPLLAVIGGSTGAGKSTLVNSIVGATVSRSGVLRPTTRASVLVHHPEDDHWFTSDRVLPGLGRVRGGTGTGGIHAVDDPSEVRLVESSALPRGLALLDAPDIDSVVTANRQLAHELMAAADLWLFVTTAARYADAVPWGLLRQAAARGTSVAIVLDRVPPEAMEEVRGHLAQMLRAEGLASAPIFTIPEVGLTPEGLLNARDVARLRSWLSALARDAKARSIIVRRTLGGALDSLRDRVTLLATASEAQVTAVEELRRASVRAYEQAAAAVESGMSDGTLLRGEVLARWQEFVGTGEFLRQVEAHISRVRDRVAAAVKGNPPPSAHLGEALQSGVCDLLTAYAQAAASTSARRWRHLPAGADLLAAHPDLASPSPDLSERAERLVRDWQGHVLELVRTEGKDRRTTARIMAFGVNGVAVVLMLVALSHTGGLAGAEVGIAGGAAVLAQRLLEAIFGDQAVRELAAKARRQLMNEVEALYAAERQRFDRALESVDVAATQGKELQTAAAAVEAAR
jgi:energy-coupling factor transporter ATP-binding protein EcfA2